MMSNGDMSGARMQEMGSTSQHGRVTGDATNASMEIPTSGVSALTQTTAPSQNSSEPSSFMRQNSSHASQPPPTKDKTKPPTNAEAAVYGQMVQSGANEEIQVPRQQASSNYHGNGNATQSSSNKRPSQSPPSFTSLLSAVTNGTGVENSVSSNSSFCKESPTDASSRKRSRIGEIDKNVPSNSEPNHSSARKMSALTENTKQEISEVTKNDQGSPSSSISNGSLSSLSPKESSHPPEDNSNLPNGETIPEADKFHVSKHLRLPPVPDKVPPLPRLSSTELAELEKMLQFDDKTVSDNGWCDDWSGDLNLFEKDIMVNRQAVQTNKNTTPQVKPFHEWVLGTARSPDGFRGVRLLFSKVYHMTDTPHMARRIMAYSLCRKAKTIKERHSFILEAVRRINYDPVVLQEDGWTTKRPDSDGPRTGAHMIGRKVLWQKHEAVVIAFVRDDGLGDLWKAMWCEDSETFDLESEELFDSIRKWEAKEEKKKRKAVKTVRSGETYGDGQPKDAAGRAASGGTSNASRSSSIRYAGFADFDVEGSEHGIILAKSCHPNARIGVFWPARIMHTSEQPGSSGKSSKRSTYQKNISVIFLAPYWNGTVVGGKAKTASDNQKGEDFYSSGSLFEIESVEASRSSVRKYPYQNLELISIDNLRTEFRFLGLPRAAFPRFLDSHRLSVALRAYSAKHTRKPDTATIAALTTASDCHALAAKTAVFPPALLELPYEYMLSQLPAPSNTAAEEEDATEKVLQLRIVLDSMSPPMCFGEGFDKSLDKNLSGPDTRIVLPSSVGSANVESDEVLLLEDVASPYLLDKLRTDDYSTPFSKCNLRYHLTTLLDLLNCGVVAGKREKRDEEVLRMLTERCFAVKSFGEEILYADSPPSPSMTYVSPRDYVQLISEWRKTCEKIYKRAVKRHSNVGRGGGTSSVITDYRCNEHITGMGTFERPVRLPAALRGAKMAGAGTNPHIPFITKVDHTYYDIAEKKIIPIAHKSDYIKRLRAKSASIPRGAKGVPLTDDSDGEGGQDTNGSQGSYTAAVVGVAAALKAVDNVVSGKCVSAFCAVRPPGHHAGRHLRAMGAVSNGFCLMNAAACAALYAVLPIAEGGKGLRRACVVDFDVHHGNGTQDILCSTYDPRFLYVSVHAGGPGVNGSEDDDFSETDSDAPGARRSLGGQKEGIFPGRCGDTSPHPGVLNLPLGQKVTAHAIGTALVTRVTPAIRDFSPDILILSAGFDAHKHDPLGMGGLSSQDFGSITDVACEIAARCCSGRIVSLLEGGYGVPCCRPLRPDQFLPPPAKSDVRLLDLGDNLPDDMDDDVPVSLRQKLDKCYAEGFLHCVKEHVSSLSRGSKKVYRILPPM